MSGSGKSSLVNEIICKNLSAKLNRTRVRPGAFQKMTGLEYLDKVINIDQSPIGRTPRSNPATYTGVFTDIRDLFSKTNDAKAKGYSAGRFSFNVKEDVVKLAKVMELRKLKCTFCRMFMFHAKFVKESAITGRH